MNSFALDKIKEVSQSTASASFFEAHKRLDTKPEIDHFLDAINDFKLSLVQSAENLNLIVQRCEALTWLDISEDKEASLQAINELIGSLLRLHEIMHRSLVRYTAASQHLQIASQELNRLETAIGDLREVAGDLDMVFFQIPSDPEMLATANKMAKL